MWIKCYLLYICRRRQYKTQIDNWVYYKIENGKRVEPGKPVDGKIVGAVLMSSDRVWTNGIDNVYGMDKWSIGGHMYYVIDRVLFGGDLDNYKDVVGNIVIRKLGSYPDVMEKLLRYETDFVNKLRYWSGLYGRYLTASPSPDQFKISNLSKFFCFAVMKIPSESKRIENKLKTHPFNLHPTFPGKSKGCFICAGKNSENFICPLCA